MLSRSLGDDRIDSVYMYSAVREVILPGLTDLRSYSSDYCAHSSDVDDMGYVLKAVLG